MEIKRAHPNDVSEIYAAEKLIFSDPWSEKDVLKTLSEEGSICFVARRDGVLCAYVLGRMIVPEGEIYRIATLPEYRGRGIAYRLLDFAVKTERGLGLESLFLEVRKSNSPARALYSSYGFTELGLRKNYYKNPPDDAIIMHLALNGDIG